jgi:hypothetical protein
MIRCSRIRALACAAVLSIWAPLALIGGTGTALVALFGAEHRVVVFADRGHEDLVFCHDATAAAGAASVAIAASDCADDHRLHVASADRIVSRHDAKSAPRVDAQLPRAVLAPLACGPVHSATRTDAPTLQPTVALQRTIVLQV